MTTQSPSYTVTYLPAGTGTGNLVWLVADKKLADLPAWQAERWVAEGKAKWVQVHVMHEQHMPPWAEVAPSTDPNVVDVWLRK